MSNEFKELTEVMKAIAEQNKGLEHLDEKIKEVVVAYLKELKIDNLLDNIPNINLSDAKFVENIRFDEANKVLSEKIITLEQENNKSKDELIIFKESISKNDLFCEKLEEKLNLLVENNKIVTDIKPSGVDSGDLAIKKDGKVVNIVINI